MATTGLRADDIMTEEVATLPDTATVGEALDLLSNLDVRHLPVMDNGELVGMVSDRDLRDCGLPMPTDEDQLDRLRALRQQPLSEIMSTDVVSVEPETPVAEVIQLMISEKVGAIPVVEERDHRLVGIISYLDVLRTAADRL